MTTEAFRAYQEQTFDSFCKTVIRNESTDARRELASRAEREIPLSSFTESSGCLFVNEDPFRYCRTYYVKGIPVDIHDHDLGESLQYIPSPRRDVILLFYILGFNDREITEILGISKDAVRIRKAAALKRLKELIEDANHV